MSNKSTEIKDIEEIAQQADVRPAVSEHFTGHFQAKQQINLALPLELLERIDAECHLQEISRQAWIKMACAEKMRDIQVNQRSKAVQCWCDLLTLVRRLVGVGSPLQFTKID